MTEMFFTVKHAEYRLQVIVGSAGVKRVKWVFNDEELENHPSHHQSPWISSLRKMLYQHLTGSVIPRYDGIPLDYSCLTPFVVKVLKQCAKIPTGEVVTYGDLARLAGSPGAARAVGQAMRKNPFPLIIPCHRVVGSVPSSMFHYTGGGSKMKRRLLRFEGIHLPPEQTGLEL